MTGGCGPRCPAAGIPCELRFDSSRPLALREGEGHPPFRPGHTLVLCEGDGLPPPRPGHPLRKALRFCASPCALRRGGYALQNLIQEELRAVFGGVGEHVVWGVYFY